MKTRILFLDDEPGTAGVMSDNLEGAGYSLIRATSLEEALKAINTGGAELLVHAVHSTKTYWSLCERIFETYPHFPSIHVTQRPLEQIYATELRGPFHQKVRPLSPIKDMLRLTRKLIFLGRLERQNATLKKTIKLQNHVDQIFETLDFYELRSRAVHFFDEEFQAKNVFYLSTGGFGYYLQEMWKVTPISPTEAGPLKHGLCSSKPAKEKDLTTLFNKISSRLPSGWEFQDKKIYLQGGNGHGPSVCLIPLVGPQSRKVLGHVVMVDPLLYGDGALERALPTVMRVLGRHVEHVLNYANAKSLTYIDDLTELYNQRYLKLVLDKEIHRASRAKSAFSVLFMDIDHFKQVNDTRGHLVGSRVLVEISKILLGQLRATDYGFRYGGDEFILVLVGNESDQALIVAERIRKLVEASTFDINGTQVNVTLSIGIATYPDHAHTKEEIIELADRAMYCGKSRSRNVVYVAS